MTVLKNGMVFISGKLEKKDILISDGKIEKIADDLKIRGMIDCTGKIILPGVIDPHVHFREPGFTQKEDFLTGSMAAAAGGITTILDMPNNIPPTLTIKDLEKKSALAKEKCIVNYGFHFGSSVDNLPEIKRVINVASTKIFMDWSTGNMKIEDEQKLEQIFRASKIVTVHAEGEKVKLAVSLSKKTRTKLYLCHISSKKEIDFLRKHKDSNIFVEVTPHHLFLKPAKKNPFREVKPSLKSKKDVDALWKAIRTGLVDTIGTDHAPHTIEEKKAKNPPSGLPGEETLVPLMLDAVNRKKVTLKKMVELCCENPARIFGIMKKGFIQVGYDADFTIVDMKLKKKVENQKLYTKCKWSPYNKKILKGWPVMTIVNGHLVFDNGYIYNYIKGKEVTFDQYPAI